MPFSYEAPVVVITISKHVRTNHPDSSTYSELYQLSTEFPRPLPTFILLFNDLLIHNKVRHLSRNLFVVLIIDKSYSIIKYIYFYNLYNFKVMGGFYVSGDGICV